MNKTWRPEEWNSKYKNVKLFSNLTFLNPNECYEAGADAMLEALFKLAKESPTQTFTIDSRTQYIYKISVTRRGLT